MFGRDPGIDPFGGGKRRVWTPAKLTGLAFWLRADLGISLNGSNVSAWADQSGSGRNVLQNTAANQPPFAASDAGFGGNAVVGALSDVDPDYLTSAAFTSIPQPYTFYAVLQLPDTVGTRDAFDLSSSFVLVRQNSTPQVLINAGLSVTASGSLTSPTILCAVFNGASSALYLNSTTAAATGNAGTNAFDLLRIGINHAGGAPAGGKYAEIFLDATANDAATRAKAMAYLSARHKITVT
jgi:hypothetical protein